MLWRYAGELSGEYQIQQRGAYSYCCVLPYLAVLAVFAFQARYEIPIRYQSVYWEAGLMKYEVQQEITDGGPENGLITLKENAKEYHQAYQAVKNVDDTKFLLLSNMTWMYLNNRNENSSYSVWLMISWEREGVLDRLETYYQMHPEKRPEVIFIEKQFDFLLDYVDLRDYEIAPLEGGHYLLYPLAESV